MRDWATATSRPWPGRSGSPSRAEPGGSPMSELLRKRHAPDSQGLVHRVTPADAGWTYVGFELYRLKPGQRVEQDTGGNEACLVIVGGRADINAGGQSW